MTEQQYNEACRYANSKLTRYQVDEALDFINDRMPMPSDTEDTITEAMDEWCRDHDLDQDEWLEWGCEEDVFFNDGEEEEEENADVFCMKIQNELHDMLCRIISRKQGAKGYVDTQNLDNDKDTIYYYGYHDNEMFANVEEGKVVALRVYQNDLQYIGYSCCANVVYSEEDIARCTQNYEDGYGDSCEDIWTSVFFETLTMQTLMSIADAIHEY